MSLIFLVLDSYKLSKPTNATSHILSLNLMLLYGNNMRGARLKLGDRTPTLGFEETWPQKRRQAR